MRAITLNWRTRRGVRGLEFAAEYADYADSESGCNKAIASSELVQHGVIRVVRGPITA